MYHSGTGPGLEGSVFGDTYGLCSWSEALKTWFPAALPCWLLHPRARALGFSPKHGCNTSLPAVFFLQGPFTPLGPSLQPSRACWHPITLFHTCPKVSVEESPSWDTQDIQAGEGLSSLCPGPTLRTDPALGCEHAGKGTRLGGAECSEHGRSWMPSSDCRATPAGVQGGHRAAQLADTTAASWRWPLQSFTQRAVLRLHVEEATVPPACPVPCFHTFVLSYLASASYHLTLRAFIPWKSPKPQMITPGSSWPMKAPCMTPCLDSHLLCHSPI